MRAGSPSTGKPCLALAAHPQFGPTPVPPSRIASFTPANVDSPFTATFFIRLLVTAAFFLSLMQYWVVVNNAGQIPVLMLYVAGFIVLLARDRVYKLSRILSGGSLLILFGMLSEVVTYFTGNSYSVQYGLILLGLFLAARLIVLQVGFLQIVRCYVYSAAACSLIILIAGRKQLADYSGAGTGRFTGGANAHPNLLGFTLASYFPLFVGMALDLPRGKKRLFFGALAVLTIVLLFTTGSRGSLGAVIAAALVTLMRFMIFNPLIGKLRFSLLTIVIALSLLAGAIFVLFHGNQLAHLIKFFITALQLDSRERGIHSGFSGRTTLWVTAIRRLQGLQWLFGAGYRQGFDIDSGYITVLFDNGILGGSVVLGSILRALYWLWRSTSRIESAGWWRYHIVLWNLIIVYLINNFTARYLFGFGNQFSLLMIFIMVCQRRELLGRSEPANTATSRMARIRFPKTLHAR